MQFCSWPPPPPPPPTTQTVALSVAGIGRVTSSPAGVDCSWAVPTTASCSPSFANGTRVTLTAVLRETPDGEVPFVKWSGGPCNGQASGTCTWVVAADTSMQAVFANGVGCPTCPAGESCVVGPEGQEPSCCPFAQVCGGAICAEQACCTNGNPVVGQGGCAAGQACAAHAAGLYTCTTANSPPPPPPPPPPPHIISVTVAGTGTVTSLPAGIACSGAQPTTVGCVASFPATTRVKLNASCAASFIKWAGGPCDGQPPRSCNLAPSFADETVQAICEDGTGCPTCPAGQACVLETPGAQGTCCPFAEVCGGRECGCPAGETCAQTTFGDRLCYSSAALCTEGSSCATGESCVPVAGLGVIVCCPADNTCAGLCGCDNPGYACMPAEGGGRACAPILYELVVSVAGNGTVTSSPSGIDCSGVPGGPSQCNAGFPRAVTLTATPAPGYLFSRWTENCSGSSPTCLMTAWESGAQIQAVFTPPTDFFVITHMVNTGVLADWAIGQGANAMEMDLQFDGAGNPTKFVHSPELMDVCDCTCVCIPQLKCPPPSCITPPCPSPGICPPLCPASGVCSSSAGFGGVGNCTASTGAAAHLEHLATKPGLALIVLDSKVTATSTDLAAAGTNVIKLLDNSLFASGYVGKVIVGSPTNDTAAYLRAAAIAASNSPNKGNIYFGIDGEEGTVVPTLQTIASLPTANRTYAAGISSCSPTQFFGDVGLGLKNQNAGVVGLVYGWTIDSSSTMDQYIQMGVRALITNEPALLVQRVQAAGGKLATPQSMIPPATSNSVVSQ